MKTLLVFLTSCVLATVSLGQPKALPEPAALKAAMDRVNAAVVGIEVATAEGAKSAHTLGMHREGTAVVIGEDGLALTIGYLILEADKITLTTADGKRLPARPIAYDLATGFGLVAPILAQALPKVALGNSAALKTGDPVIISTGGDEGEYGLTELVGQRKFSGYWEYHIEEALFTSPPIQNHSGAGVFNLQGELLGVGSLFVGDARGSSVPSPGNMFVPVSLLKPILAELRSKGFSAASRRPWMGVSSVERDGKIIVTRVAPASPASDAGLRAGDIISAIDGRPIRELEALYKALWMRASAISEVELTIETSGASKTLKLRTVDRMETLVQPRAS